MNKKKYRKTLFLPYLRYFFLFIFSNNLLAQEYTEAYLEIRSSDQYSKEVIESKLDSLLVGYKEQHSSALLALHLYDYAKWLYGNGMLDKAIARSVECLDIIDSLSDFDSEIQAKAQNNLGFFYGKKGNYFMAYKAYKDLAEIAETKSAKSRAYQLVGRNLRYMGDFFTAAEHYEIALDLSRNTENATTFVINSIDAAINYKEIGTIESFNRGIAVLEEGIALKDQVNNSPNAHKNSIPVKDEFSLYNHLGNLYNDREDYNFDKAKENYMKALDLARELKDESRLALVHNDLGYLFLQDGNGKAITYFKQALTYKSDSSLRSKIFANISLCYERMGNRAEAIKNVQKSITMLAPLTPEDPGSLPLKEAIDLCEDKTELLHSLIQKAKLWGAKTEAENYKIEDLKQALNTFYLADYLVDMIRFESKELKSKLYWRKVASDVYANAIKVCYKLNKDEEGFYFMEKSKAVLLQEDISWRQLKEKANLPTAVEDQFVELESRIVNYNRLMNDSEVEKDSLRPLLLQAKDDYRAFTDSIQGHYKWIPKKVIDLQLVSLSKTIGSLDKETGYLTYSIGKNDSYGMLISSNGAHFFKIRDPVQLHSDIGHYRALIERPFETSKDLDVYQKLAFSIYRALLPKLELKKLPIKNLIIVPNGYLHEIPFESLLTSNHQTSYLLKQYAISYAYSVSFLLQNAQRKYDNNFDFIGFAPVNFKSTFPDLPQSKLEVERAASLFSSSLYLGAEATTENFARNIGQKSIVHLASHSNLGTQTNPWILFADKKLALEDLYLLKNTAELVVLSACKTSAGTLQQGEGVMSLARGFFQSGANSVLATLWNANDLSSRLILQDFYLGVKKGKTRSQALRKAKLKYLSEAQLSELSPYYWSSLVLIGNPNRLSLSENNGSFYSIIPLLLLLFLGVLFYYHKKRTRTG